MTTKLRRLSRLGEFRILFLGMLLVAVALSTVGTFSERMEQAMQLRTSAMLGADVQISSTRPIKSDYAELATSLGLDTTETVSFMSMLITDAGSRLAGVRAVSSNYPLRGKVVLKHDDNGAQSNRLLSPNPGSIWAASQLVKDLGLTTDLSVELGDSQLAFKEEIILEPEGGAGMLRFAPRVLMNLQDLDATGLLTPASRARFRLLVAGPAEALRDFELVVKSRLEPAESWRSADIRQQQVRNTVGRIVAYVRLAVLLSIILSVVAMALAAQGIWGLQAKEVALLRCLGQKHGKTLRTLTTTYFFAAIPAALTGVALGYFLQEIASRFVEKTTAITLPSPSGIPSSIALMVCVITLAAVMMPILLSIKNVSTISLLRSFETDSIKKNKLAIYSVLGLIIVLTVVLSQDPKLAFGILFAFVLASVILWSSIRGFIFIVNRMSTPRSSAWYVGLKSVCSNSSRSAWMSSTFAVIIFALVLLGISRNEIFDAWQESIPNDAPNLFLVNIKESNISALKLALEKNGVDSVAMLPLIRSRITRINNQPLADKEFDSARSRHRANHEFNLTELFEIPEGNIVTAGEWMNTKGNSFSVDQETAVILGLEIGDMLEMDVAGKIFSAPVTSFRSVKWDNLKPNFYIIASPGTLDGAARNFTAGVYVESDRNELVFKINQEFPNVTAIDLGMLIERFRGLVVQGSNAISMVFLFTLITAALVFVGVLQGQRSARKQQIALLKSFGASRSFIRSSILFEFSLLGIVAGLIGSSLAILSSWYLAEYIFELPFEIPWHWMTSSAAISALLVSTTGYLSIRKLIDSMPMRLLSSGPLVSDF